MKIIEPNEQTTEQGKLTFHLHSAARHPLKIKPELLVKAD